jgi:hypothetical protein
MKVSSLGSAAAQFILIFNSKLEIAWGFGQVKTIG